MLHSDLGGCIVKWDADMTKVSLRSECLWMTAVFLSVDGQSSLYLMESLVSPDHCFGDRLVLSS